MSHGNGCQKSQKLLSVRTQALGMSYDARELKIIYWVCSLCLIRAVDRTLAQSAIASMVVPKAGCSGRPCTLEDPTIYTGKEESFGLNLHVFLGEAKLQGQLSPAFIHNQSLGVARSPGVQSVLVWWETCRFNVQPKGCRRLEHYSEGGCGLEGVRAGTV